MSREYYFGNDEAMSQTGELEQALIVKRMFGEYVTDKQIHEAREKDTIERDVK